MKKILPFILAMVLIFTPIIMPNMAITVKAEVEETPNWERDYEVEDYGDLMEALSNAISDIIKIVLMDNIYFEGNVFDEINNIQIRSNQTVMITSGENNFIIDANLNNGPAIENYGELWLENVKITGADNPGFGGGIYNIGTLIIGNGVEITGNNAGFGGGIYNGSMSYQLNRDEEDDEIISVSGIITIKSGAKIINNNANQGGGIYNDGGVVNINGGEISYNTAEQGGGIYNVNKSSSHNMLAQANQNPQGVEDIQPARAGDDAAGLAISEKYNGELNITGGSISYNTANIEGGGIYNGGMLNMNGGTIAYNNAENGGGVYNSYYIQQAVLQLLRSPMVIQQNKNAVCTGEFIMSGGSINNNTVNGDGGGIYNSGLLEMNSNATISSNIAYNNGGGVFTGGTFNMENGTISENNAGWGGGVYNSTAMLAQANQAPQGILQLSRSMADDDAAGLEISDDRSGGEFNMNNGKIINNTADYNGGGVFNCGQFIMQNGEISGNKAIENDDRLDENFGEGLSSGFRINRAIDINNNGGGVYNIGEFTIKNNAKISNNEATQGGGVYNAIQLAQMAQENLSAESNMRINNASDDAENLNDKYGGCVTMDGGEISGNKAENGGGILNGGLFIMNAGTIKNNIAENNGGGLYNGILVFKEILTLSRSRSEDDSENGSGEFEGEFIMNGGSINNNTAGNDGGGIWTYDLSKVSTDNAVFSNNKASAVYKLNLPLDDEILHNNQIKNTKYTIPFEHAYSNADINYTPVEDMYTVIYDANGANSGTVPVDSILYGVGVNVKVFGNTGTLAKTGYTFAGWKYNTNTYTSGEQFTMPDENVILYAVWNSNTVSQPETQNTSTTETTEITTTEIEKTENETTTEAESVEEETTEEEPATTNEPEIEDTINETTTESITEEETTTESMINDPITTTSDDVQTTQTTTETFIPESTNPANVKQTFVLPNGIELLEKMQEGAIPLTNGWFAIDLGNEIWEIFDENGKPLGIIILSDNENINDIDISFIEANIIPLGNVITAEQIEPMNDNPLTGDNFIISFGLLILIIVTAVFVNKKKAK